MACRTVFPTQPDRGVLPVAAAGQVARDAAAVTIAQLRRAIASQGDDPAALARHLGLSVVCVLRRMAALPEVGAGLVVCDRSGTIIFRKSVQGFNVPRHAAACPLWPLFAVLGQPGMVLSERIEQVGRGQAPFISFAACEAQSLQGYNQPPLTQAVMLLVPATEGSGDAREVGTTCRVCPQQSCTARREPSILNMQG